MIGKLLCHTQVQTTARYAHLAVEPIKLAANIVSGAIGHLLNGGGIGDEQRASGRIFFQTLAG
jgi:hypothetical protein